MLGKKKKNNIVKLGSETKCKAGIIHLFKDGDNGDYCVWLQPVDKFGRRLYTNWKRLCNGSLSECRQYVKRYIGNQ